MLTKAELRNTAKNIRKNLDMKTISHKILNNFVASDFYKTYKKIATYYPYGSEVDITPLFQNETKTFFIPKILKNNEMSFHQFNLGDILNPNTYGIKEPTTPEINNKEIELMILPALMVDNCGYRLGYGKGYYDKFLSSNKLDIKKIVLLPDELLCEKIPKDEFDIPVDIIITQEKTIIIQ